MAYHNHAAEFCCDSGSFDCNLECDGTAALDDCNECTGGSSGRVANADKDCLDACDGPAVRVPTNPSCRAVDPGSVAAVAACSDVTGTPLDTKTACDAVTTIDGGCIYNGLVQG